MILQIPAASVIQKRSAASSFLFFTCLCLNLLANMVSAPVCSAANYPLEIIQPQPNLNTANRYYKAYPGIPYSVRPGVIGGAYPFRYSLTSAPPGMSINQDTGEIIWPNPAAAGSPHTVTISVTDAENITVTRTWAITVTTANTFFVDASNGRSRSAGASGSISDPWRNLDDVYYGTSAGDMVYFRNGTYTLEGLPVGSFPGNWYRVDWGNTRAKIFLAYPGESPVINHGFQGAGTVHNAPMHRFSAEDLYIDGFEVRNGDNIFFQLGGGNRAVIRNCVFHHLLGGVDGSNSSAIMFLTNAPREHTVVQDNEFHTIIGATSCWNEDGNWSASCDPHNRGYVSPGTCGVKLYDGNKTLFEDNVFHNIRNGAEGLALKGGVMTNVHVRHNRFYDMEDRHIDGNMHTLSDVEVSYNFAKDDGTDSGNGVVWINSDGVLGPAYFVRNTFVGRVNLKMLDNTHGPVHFAGNVIVNDETARASRIMYELAVDESRLTVANHLAGARNEGIVDVDGRLVGAYRAEFLGARGYELASSVADTTPPQTPQNLVVQ